MVLGVLWPLVSSVGPGNGHLPGITAIHDDICIYGHTPKYHDQHLLQLMQTAKEHDIYL